MCDVSFLFARLPSSLTDCCMPPGFLPIFFGVQVITDPVTGEVKKKKKNGGAYPGQGGQQHAPYQPPASAFQNGQATAHFVSYGGGNALTLQQADGTTKPQHGGPEAGQFVNVTLPAGVESGQKIHVKAPGPNGRINEIIIPPGYGPGMSFTVEFAPESAAPGSYAPAAAPSNKVPAYEAAAINNTRPPPTTSSVPPAAANHADDGFASGFNNPNWTPPPPTASATVQDPEFDISAYPTSEAVPVASGYSAPPKY